MTSPGSGVVRCASTVHLQLMLKWRQWGQVWCINQTWLSTDTVSPL